MNVKHGRVRTPHSPQVFPNGFAAGVFYNFRRHSPLVIRYGLVSRFWIHAIILRLKLLSASKFSSFLLSILPHTSIVV